MALNNVVMVRKLSREVSKSPINPPYNVLALSRIPARPISKVLQSDKRVKARGQLEAEKCNLLPKRALDRSKAQLERNWWE